MIKYLSKSDFKIAHDCPTKLYYRKKYYPNSKDENEYLQHLARGGYMVGKLATLLFADGLEIDTGRDHDEAIRVTKELLLKEKVTIFEAAIESNGKLIRIDILEKYGNTINLIEVKSKSYETTNDPSKRKKNDKELEAYILDVAFQCYVMKESYPEWDIKPFLLLPDKSKNTKIEGLTTLFNIEEMIDDNSKFRKYHVSYEGCIEELRSDDLMTLIDVEQKVNELQPLIINESNLFLKSLVNGVKKIDNELSKECFKCEFNVIDEGHPVSGFNECWCDYPVEENHIKDLFHIGSIGGYKNPFANELIKQKKISFLEFPIGILKEGAHAKRQKVQIKNTLENLEWVNPDLSIIINSLEYPIHFIDFETAISALPMHKNMRPYEVVNFQWSCHTIDNPYSNVRHTEWINLEPIFPSFKFAESLMETIGTRGTHFIWSPYENTMLKTIYNQYQKYGYNNAVLKEWLEFMVKFGKDDEGKFVDMNRLALDNYFHPAMKGKTSIKWTLPAVLKATTSTRIEDLLNNYEEGLSLLKRNEKNEIINPYQLLPGLDIYDEAETIKDGTGAMQAYEDIMWGLRKGNLDDLEKYRKALLRYCKLDTLAMVIIWVHWKNLLESNR
jgi:hypothetical protein